jgi:hypothetical protein
VDETIPKTDDFGPRDLRPTVALFHGYPPRRLADDLQKVDHHEVELTVGVQIRAGPPPCVLSGLAGVVEHLVERDHRIMA